MGTTWQGAIAVIAIAAALVVTPATPAAPVQTEALRWDLVSVGPHGRSVRVFAEWGSCGRVLSNVHEARTTVMIELAQERLPVECAGVGRAGLRDIPLFHPLAGRRIVGVSRRSTIDHAGVFLLLGGVMPRLIGLSRSDARQVVALLRLTEHIRIAHRTRGLPRVLGQFPAPGQRPPKSGVVRLALAE